MLIWVGEPYCRLITTQEGMGDNLSADDIRDGYVDYWMSSLYEQDGEDITLVDSGQILTSKYIGEMDDNERIRRVLEYWSMSGEDYVILEH